LDCNWWWKRVSDQRSRQGGPRSGFTLLAVSKMAPRENPMPIIEAFAAFAGSRKDARLIYVGDGPLRDAVDRRIDELGIRPRVELPGYVKYETLPTFYSRSDAFVHAPAAEPWGISVSEALASGIPVIASSVVGAAADLVIPGRTGVIVPPGDVRAMVAALKEVAMWNDRPTLELECRRSAAQVDIDAAARAIEELVEGLRDSVERPGFRAVLRGVVRNEDGAWSP
jgi:glycosyltransferase involved in cell wall biosynthesis